MTKNSDKDGYKRGRTSGVPVGREGEEIALRFLSKKKFKILERGFRLHRGEIDIIARDGETLVFVEVKARTGNTFGRPEESVTPAKQNQIRKLAQGYLFKRGMGAVRCRFDVVSILILKGGSPQIEHFTDAF